MELTMQTRAENNEIEKQRNSEEKKKKGKETRSQLFKIIKIIKPLTTQILNTPEKTLEKSTNY